MAQTDERVVEIDRAPSHRALPVWRGRSTKRAIDVDLWRQVMAPVRELVADGWRTTRVSIDFGSRMPLTPEMREQACRDVTDCVGSCDLEVTSGSPGRGRTTFHLERCSE